MRLKTFRSYFEATARQRVAGVFDKNSFAELCPPSEQFGSPHLKHFNIPLSFDDGVVVGDVLLGGMKICCAAQEGRFMGGAIGEVHSAKIVGILKRCLKKKPEAMVFLFDSGGVRLQEANAGEIGVAEIIRALLDVRYAGIPVIGAIGGSCGVFGGAGIISGCCDALVVSEEARIGVSGPEVIETNMGVDVFDSRDRALVWRTCGGKHRYILEMADDIVENSMEAFRNALIKLMKIKKTYDLAGLEKEHEILKKRSTDFSDCRDGFDVWRKIGFSDVEKIPSLTVEDLKAQQKNRGGVK
ncbi:MAG: biotin-independent malonate decarboxylase subunit beta [Lentisphaerae bacterium GWF2_45_14]|nr:MAG: biotin-independent malonate decarboxylase subunit beta [Lentisphaerae bacterium GWF2_45_14]